jgi:hypothetical protein
VGVSTQDVVSLTKRSKPQEWVSGCPQASCLCCVMLLQTRSLGVGGTAVAASEAEAHDSTLVVSAGLVLQPAEKAARSESLQVPVQYLEPHLGSGGSR